MTYTEPLLAVDLILGWITSAREFLRALIVFTQHCVGFDVVSFMR
jgi:hypothetical protein